MSYRRHDNCFSWIEDVPRAQTLMDEQLKVHWVQLLDPLAQGIHPLLFSELSVNYPMKYYWTCGDSEWATDLMFRQPERLRRLVPQMLHLGIVSFSSADVLRFIVQSTRSKQCAKQPSEARLATNGNPQARGQR